MARILRTTPQWNIKIAENKKKDDFYHVVTGEYELLYEGENKSVKFVNENYVIYDPETNEEEIFFTPREWERIPDNCFKRANPEYEHLPV